MRAFNFIKNIIKRRKTAVSAFAILNQVDLEDHVYISNLAKCERAKIGKGTTVGTMAAIYDAEIGRFCSIARDCYIGGASHPLDWVSTSGVFYMDPHRSGISYGKKDFHWNKKTIIGNDVWLGARTIVKAGVSIGTGAVVGSGSVVTKNIGPYEIWAGNPARMIRKRFDDETIGALMKTEWWEWDDEKLRKNGATFSDVSQFLNECI